MLLICHMWPHWNSQLPGHFQNHCMPKCYGLLWSGANHSSISQTETQGVSCTHKSSQIGGILQYFHVPLQHCSMTLPRFSSASPVLPPLGRQIQVHQAHGKDTRQARREEHVSWERSKKISKSTFVLTEDSKNQEELFPNTFMSIKAHAYKELTLGYVWTPKESAKKKKVYELTVSLSYMLLACNSSKMNH